MTHCERLSDRMPEVALHGGKWSAEEEHHLSSCADCGAEWELLRIAAGLGASLPLTGDSDASAAGVLGRLAHERVAARTRRRVWLAAGLAAAAVAVIAVRIPRSPAPTIHGTTSAVSSAPQSVPIPELDGLPASQLESILGALDASLDVSTSLDGPAFDDFDGPELDSALAGWEG